MKCMLGVTELGHATGGFRKAARRPINTRLAVQRGDISLLAAAGRARSGVGCSLGSGILRGVGGRRAGDIGRGLVALLQRVGVGTGPLRLGHLGHGWLASWGDGSADRVGLFSYRGFGKNQADATDLAA